MTNTIEKLTNNFYLLVESADKKLDPKAKVRSRGTVVFPAESKSVKDKKDHFPINNADQARNAWARANQYSSVPAWYSGSLKGLQDTVRRKVKGKFPGIEFAEKKKANLNINIEKNAISIENVDMSIDKAILHVKNLVKHLEGLKHKIRLEFNPELEHVIVSLMPEIANQSDVGVKRIQYMAKK